MDSTNFVTTIDGFQRWRAQLAEALSDYQSWVERYETGDGEQDLRVYELIESLKTDKLVVALVAEFSRGKTELLNAIFFADHKVRLLPSSAGRTTMCPTELRFDEADGPCVKLLPIETRKTSLTISEYKKTPIHWTKIHLVKPNDTAELREALKEVTRTKQVNVREAQELGLYDPDKKDDSAKPDENGMIEVPMWRHAVINYPHPLLRQGLVVLDTPGLNALGAEPELTLNMLPNAHAVLFVLAADTGVTKTDLEVWRNHVCSAKGTKDRGRLVALNKVDVLWDELRDDAAVEASVRRQIDETARTLGIERNLIFPVSAQKGLTGKIKNDDGLLARSGLYELEIKLAQDIVPAKHEYIRTKILYEVSNRVEASRGMLQARHGTTAKQLVELKSLGGKNLDAIQKIVANMRAEKAKYDKELEGFQLTRNALSQQAKSLSSYLSIKSFDKLIKHTRRDMHESWTTRGLNTGMKTFFDGITERMDSVAKEADAIKRVVQGIYQRLHKEYGLAEIAPPNLSLAPFVIELRKLKQKADDFRSSPVTMMTEQHFVIQKFFITLVSRARQTFEECHAATKSWFQAVVSPVFQQIQSHKAMIDNNLERLKKIHDNLDSLGERITELEREKEQLEKELKTLDQLVTRIHQPIH